MIHQLTGEVGLQLSFHPVLSVVRRDTTFQPFNFIEVVADVLKAATTNIMPIIDGIHGCEVEFYFPMLEDEDPSVSIYSSQSNRMPYPTHPNMVKRAVGVGIFVDRYESGVGLDVFLGPSPIIFLEGDEELPECTRLRIKIKFNKYLAFQVERSENMYGLDRSILRKLILNPIAW